MVHVNPGANNALTQTWKPGKPHSVRKAEGLHGPVQVRTLLSFTSSVSVTTVRLSLEQARRADPAAAPFPEPPPAFPAEQEGPGNEDLFGEDGYFGVKKTARRISDFVIGGAGGGLDRLKAGRDGVLQGFREAGKAWGGKLPEISAATIDAALKTIDEAIAAMGGSVIDATL
jgi:hypothetical protein